MTSDAIRAAAFEKYTKEEWGYTGAGSRRIGFIAGAEWAQKNTSRPAPSDMQILNAVGAGGLDSQNLSKWQRNAVAKCRALFNAPDAEPQRIPTKEQIAEAYRSLYRERVSNDEQFTPDDVADAVLALFNAPDAESERDVDEGLASGDHAYLPEEPDAQAPRCIWRYPTGAMCLGERDFHKEFGITHAFTPSEPAPRQEERCSFVYSHGHCGYAWDHAIHSEGSAGYHLYVEPAVPWAETALERLKALQAKHWVTIHELIDVLIERFEHEEPKR